MLEVHRPGRRDDARRAVAAPGVETQVHHEAIEPGIEARAALEAIEIHVCLEEGVLHGIARALFVAQHAQRKPVRAALVAFDQDTECLGIAAPSPGDGLAVAGIRFVGTTRRDRPAPLRSLRAIQLRAVQNRSTATRSADIRPSANPAPRTNRTPGRMPIPMRPIQTVPTRIQIVPTRVQTVPTGMVPIPAIPWSFSRIRLPVGHRPRSRQHRK